MSRVSTAGVVIAPAVLASVSGGGTALVELVAVVAMGFVAYAFVIFTRGFNSAGSVYGFTGAVAGPVFGFISAWTLMLVYASFAGGIYAVTADEAQPAFGAVGLHLPWQASRSCRQPTPPAWPGHQVSQLPDRPVTS